MKLRTLVLLVTASTLVVFCGVSEVLSYQQAAEFFARHEIRIRTGGEPEALLAALRQEKQSLLRESVGLRILTAAGAVGALSIALNLLLGRLVSRPIKLLVERINSMSRGTWTQPIPVEREDEMGKLVGEFNLLGPKLTFVAHQYAAASKLAAMALSGQRVTRRTNIARSQLVEIQNLLSEARYSNHAVPPATVEQIGRVAQDLANLAMDLDSEFNDELVRQSLPAQIWGDKGRASKARRRHDELMPGLPAN